MWRLSPQPVLQRRPAKAGRLLSQPGSHQCPGGTSLLPHAGLQAAAGRLAGPGPPLRETGPRWVPGSVTGHTLVIVSCPPLPCLLNHTPLVSLPMHVLQSDLGLIYPLTLMCVLTCGVE